MKKRWHGFMMILLLPTAAAGVRAGRYGTLVDLRAPLDASFKHLSVSCETQFSSGENMQDNTIPAEIMVMQSHTQTAALALQRLGFRIMHIGATISVEGPERLWTSVFNVTFVTLKKKVLAEIEGGDAYYRKAITDNLKIPEELQQYISGVAFIEPPELF